MTMTKTHQMWIKALGPGLTPSVLPPATTTTAMILMGEITVLPEEEEEEEEEEEGVDGIWYKIW